MILNIDDFPLIDDSIRHISYILNTIIYHHHLSIWDFPLQCLVVDRNTSVSAGGRAMFGSVGATVFSVFHGDSMVISPANV